MGMYDDVIVEQECVEGLPIGCYQTKDLACGLDLYIITSDKYLVLSKSYEPERYWGGNYPKHNNAVPINLNGKLNVYTDSVPGRNWLEGLLTIENGIVISFEETYKDSSDFDLDKIEWSYI